MLSSGTYSRLTMSVSVNFVLTNVSVANMIRLIYNGRILVPLFKHLLLSLHALAVICQKQNELVDAGVFHIMSHVL